MKRIFFMAVCVLLLTNACRTPKDVAYFQGIHDLTAEQVAQMNQKYVPRICIDDALIIYVTSPDRATVAQFTVSPYGYYMPGESEIGIAATTQNLFTYLVDENGFINFPELGRILMAGLSINEATRMMEDKIRVTAPTAVVSVQIANFKVSIFGEVKTPNTFTIRTPRVSIFDLISMAGDLTIMADRKEVTLLRDNNGVKVPVKFDLTDPAIIASPYYYLQQNDVVYVKPNNAQQRNALNSLKDNTRISLYSVFLSTISILITAIVNFRE